MRKFKDRNYVGVSAGKYPWIPVDTYAESFSVTFAATMFGTGQVSANIEGTLDNVQDPTVSANAFFIVTALASTGNSVDGLITQPCAALRLSVAVSGSANVRLKLLQAGPDL